MEDEDDLRHIFTDVESDEDFDLSDDWSNIDDALKPPRTSKTDRRRGPDREQNLDPEVQALIGEAQQAFSAGEHEVAIKLAEEAIAVDANARIAYNLLSAIYDDIGDPHKALLAKIMAAHLNKKNKEDWIEIAERSIEQNEVAQASFFYQTASRIARDDWTLLLKRAQLHTQLGQLSRALSLLTRLRERFFTELPDDAKTQVLLHLARVLKLLGRMSDATDLYVDMFNKSLYPARYGEPEVVLNWQNLNVLGELLFDQGNYAWAIRTLKSGSRWILGRGGESQWNEVPDDSEFDDRRLNRPEYNTDDAAAYELPIDIRIWLLVCRLKQIRQAPTASEDALVHLEYLKQCVPVEDYGDLYARAGAALFQAKMYQHALEIYSQLTDIPYETQAEYLNMTIEVAKCHMELGNIKQAEGLYKFVTSTDDHNVEALVALGEIYQATNRPAGAKLMVERVYMIREEEARAAATRASPLGEAGEPPRESSTSFVDSTPRPRPPTARLTAAERAELERQAQARADHDYGLLDRFQTGLESDNAVAAGEWIRAAMDLVDMFSSHRKFFPSDRNKVFSEMRTKALDARVQNLQEAGDDDDSNPSESEYLFRGRRFEFWFGIFMRAALARARYESVEGAYTLVRTARASNIFHLDPRREQIMSLVMLACGALVNDCHTISDTLRQMYMARQFDNDILRLYGALLASGLHAQAVFGSSNNQKFFLRQIKAVDSVVQKKAISGAARIAASPTTQETENPLLFVLYAHIMLMGPSYVPAQTYLMRALAFLPNDPMVLLTLAVVHVQRAVQRVTTNRHLQILQGLSYLQDYVAVRQGSKAQKQEADYNFGRYFHGLGLFSLAIPYYKKVCKYTVDPEYDLTAEAAYNLHLIYAMTGNMQLSREIVDTYLVV